MSTAVLIWLCRYEASRQHYDAARHRSYLDELRRRERETHSYGWLQMQRLAQGGKP